MRRLADAVPHHLTGNKRLLLSLIVVALVVLAMAPGVAAQDVYSERTLEIARRLQCPVCSGQSVADSGSQLAGQMRAIIEEKVQAGESDQQIIDFFVARYGESIMTDPPKSGFTLGLWWMPVTVVVLAAVVVGMFIRERTRAASPSVLTTSTAAVDSHDEELEAIARDVLGTGDSEMVSNA